MLMEINVLAFFKFWKKRENGIIKKIQFLNSKNIMEKINYASKLFGLSTELILLGYNWSLLTCSAWHILVTRHFPKVNIQSRLLDKRLR